MLPDDFKQFTAMRSRGDGNCLFNSTSISLQGDEKLAGILRLLVTCELLVHSEFYPKHPQLDDMTNVKNGYTKNSLIWVLLSDQTASDVYDGKLENLPAAITVLAKKVSTPGVYATPYHVMSLSSIIGRPIHSVYPDMKSSIRVKNSIHRTFLPRDMFLAKTDTMLPPIYIMWTTISPCDHNMWRPNHFVPLIPLKKKSTGVLTYTDVVRGHTKKVNMEKESKVNAQPKREKETKLKAQSKLEKGTKLKAQSKLEKENMEKETRFKAQSKLEEENKEKESNLKAV